MSDALIAAVDLGSNSFRLQTGRIAGGRLHLLQMIREPVRLALGLGTDRKLDAAAQRRALEALQRFHKCLHGVAAEAVSAVATNTLRVAGNAAAFLAQAEAALGFPIKVISGLEEARLIYLGVAHAMAGPAGRLLVVDIGGGSTEVIVGNGLVPLRLASLEMGCVNYTLRHFSDGRVSRAGFRQAELAARQELLALQAAYREIGWQQAVASSGTAKAIADLLAQNGLNDPVIRGGIGRREITHAGLQRLKELLLHSGGVGNLQLAGLRPDRSAVLPGGLAIMAAVFEAFGLERMSFSEGGLCLGMLHERFPAGAFRDTVQQPGRAG